MFSNADFLDGENLDLVMNHTVFGSSGAQAAGQSWTLPEDRRRIGLILTNTGAGDVQIVAGNEASANFGYLLKTGAAPLVFGNPRTTPKQLLSFYFVGASTISFAATYFGGQE